MSGVTTTGKKLQYCTDVGRACHFTKVEGRELDGESVYVTKKCFCGNTSRTRERAASAEEKKQGKIIPGTR